MNAYAIACGLQNADEVTRLAMVEMLAEVVSAVTRR